MVTAAALREFIIGEEEKEPGVCPSGEGQDCDLLMVAKDTCGRVRDEAFPCSLVMTDQDTPNA